MAKKKKSGKGVARFLTPDNALNDFVNTATSAILRTLANYGKRRDRLVVTHAKRSGIMDDHFSVSVSLTDGAFALFPFVDRDSAADYDSKYYAKMRDLEAQYGNDIEKWPPDIEIAPDLANGDLLLFTFYIEKIRNKNVAFRFSISISRNEKEIMLKSLDDIDFEDPDVDDENPDIVEITNTENSIDACLQRQIEHWLFDNESAWLTSQMREALDMLSDAAFRIWFSTPLWRLESIDTWHIGKSVYFQIDGLESTEVMGESPIKAKCREIIGDYFNPGSAAAFFLEARINMAARMEITLRGPIPVKPAEIRYKHELVELARNADVIYSRTLDYNSNEQPGDQLDGDEALSLASEVLETLGIVPSWKKEDEDDA